MRRAVRWETLLPRGAFFRGVLSIAAGTGAGQLIVIAASPVITRLYTPSEYGVYAVATSALAILVNVTCLRYEFAIPLPESNVTAANVLALSLFTNIAVSLLTGIALWVGGAWLLAVLGASALAPYVMLLVVGQVSGGVVSALTNWAVRTREFSELAVNRVAQGGAQVLTQVGLGALGLGAPGLLIGAVIGGIAGSTRLATVAWRAYAGSFRSVSRSGVLAAAARYRRFPIFSSGSALLAVLGQQLPLLLIVALFGASAGGEYALATRVCAMPVSLVAGAVGNVFVAESARLARDEPTQVRALFAQTTRSLALTAAGPLLLIGGLAPLLFGPVFGPQWSEAGMFVAVLAPAHYARFVAAATGDILYVVERQNLQLIREIVRFCLIGGAIPVAALLQLTPLGAMVLLSVDSVVTYGVYGAISWRAVVAHRTPIGVTRPEGNELGDELAGLRGS